MGLGHDLTLADLVEHGPLGLVPIVRGDLNAKVRGAHAIEIEQPTKWLRPGWLMLTTGLRFATNRLGAASQAELVDELADAGVPGLLFGVGVHFDAVPRGLVEAATRRGLTLLAVPVEVSFLEVEDLVSQATLAADTYALRRTLWFQNELLEALADDEPVTAVVARLGSVIRGSAVLYEETGRIVASTGEAPSRLIWSEIRAHGVGRQSFTIGRWFVATRPVVVRGTAYWLALSSRRSSTLADLGESLLDTAQRLLAAIGGAKALGTTQARAEATQLLRVLHDGISPEESVRLHDRLRAYRFVPHHPLRALAAVPVGPRGAGAPAPPAVPVAYGGTALETDPMTRLHDHAVRHGLPVLTSVVSDPDPYLPSGSIEGVVADAPNLAGWLSVLAETHHIGLSEPYAELMTTRASSRDARRAARVALRRRAERPADARRPGVVVRFEDVDLATWLVSARSHEAVRAKATQQLQGLFDREELVATVIAYLACDLDVGRTAEQLFLHPNSVRYRLRRVEEIVSAPISSPAVIANLYLAFVDDLEVRPANAEPHAPDGAGGSPEGG